MIIACIAVAYLIFSYFNTPGDRFISSYLVELGVLFFIICLMLLLWNAIFYKKLSHDSIYGLLISVIIIVFSLGILNSRESGGSGPQTRVIIGDTSLGELLSNGGPSISSIRLSADKTYEKSFSITGEDEDIMVYGDWSAGGSDLTGAVGLNVLVLNDEEYHNWSSNQPFDALYYSKWGTHDSMMLPIDKSGIYHVVISNVGSTESKLWQGELSLIWRNIPTE